MRKIFADHCFELVELGFSIFPLSAGSKIPVKGTKGVKDATTDRAVVSGWAKRWPGANIGIATGIPSGVLVIDFDPRNGSEASVAKLAKARRLFPQTISCKTANGGRHFYYAYAENIKNSASKLAEGIDVKTTGGYVVAPPSMLESPDKVYSWIIHPMGNQFPRLPNWIVQALTPPPAPKFTRKTADLPKDIGPLAKWLSRAASGDRNNSLYWASCRAGQDVREGRASPGDAFGTLLSAALAIGLPRDEAEKTINSGLKMSGGAA
jgi:hypothetical protein